MNDLRVQFGDIDIYLFDQLLRGRIAPGMRTSSTPAAAAAAISSTSSRTATTSPPSTGDPAAVEPVAGARRPAGARAARRQLPRRADRGDELPGRRRPTSSSPARCCTSRRDRRISTRCCAACGASSRPAGCCSARLASSIGIDDRGRAARRRPVPAARWQRSLPRRRAHADGTDAPPRRRTPRSAQDDGRAAAARDDDLGREEARLNGAARRACDNRSLALTATIYNLDIDLADSDRSVYETLALRVARHPSESAEYLVARVLAYADGIHRGIEFSRGIRTRTSPRSRSAT